MHQTTTSKKSKTRFPCHTERPEMAPEHRPIKNIRKHDRLHGSTAPNLRSTSPHPSSLSSKTKTDQTNTKTQGARWFSQLLAPSRNGKKVIFVGTSLGSKNHSKNRSRHRGPPQFKSMCGHTCLQGAAKNCSRRCKIMETQRYAKPVAYPRKQSNLALFFKKFADKTTPVLGSVFGPQNGGQVARTSKSN